MSQIETELQDRVLCVSINRPEKKNALTSAMYNGLADAFDQADVEPGVAAILLCGKGDSFTAGNDLEDFLARPWKGQDMPPAERFIRAVAGARKPVVAAVHGAAVGIGTTILLHCDLVYAADNARLLMPFVNLGIVPEAGSTLLLPALIGHQRAAELLLLGSPLTAQQACVWGLVNAVVPLEALAATARDAAKRLAEKPPAALQATKRLLKQTHVADLDRVIREEVLLLGERIESPEARESLAAFFEKRKPDFAKLR